MLRFFTTACLCLATGPAFAQSPRPEDVAPLVARATEAFLQAIAERDEARQRAFFAPGLAQMATPERWAEQRTMIEGRVGPLPAYIPHKVTWYPQETLFVAVDFSTVLKEAESYICGTLIWELPASDVIGLVRLEENIVEREVFSRMAPDSRQKTLSDWFCPPDLIEVFLALPNP